MIEAKEVNDGAPLAVTRIQVQDSTHAVLIDLMAVAEELQGKGVGSWVLRRVERMATELGMATVLIEIAQCRHDLASWLMKRGYRQIGGYLSEDLKDPNTSQPITILQFQVGGATRFQLLQSWLVPSGSCVILAANVATFYS